MSPDHRWQPAAFSTAGLPGLAALLIAGFALIPLGFVVWITIATGWDTLVAMVFRPRVGDLLINTLLLELLTLPLAVVVAVAQAWTTERCRLPAARLWAWLAVAPLAIPAFVHSYAWISLSPGLGGLGAGVLVSVLAYSPFLYLPVAAQLRRLDPALEDQAAALGLGPGRVFLRVVLPQLRLAILGGSLLVGLHLLSEYGLYVMIRFDTFATAIMDQFQSAYNGPAANMLGLVLVVSCLLLITLENRLAGRGRYARLGAGAPRRAERRPLTPWLVPILGGQALVALLALGVPAYTLGRWLWLGGVAVWTSPALLPAIGQTFALALGGGVLTTLAALPMAWIAIRRPGRLSRALEACHYYVGALPGIVIALALVSLTIRVATPLYQTAATLLGAYLLMFLPRALVGLKGSIAQVPVELEQAAMALGHSPLRALGAITLRLAAPGAAAGAALVALAICNELTATLMLAPNGTETLATRFWALSSEIDYVAAAPYAALMVLLSLPMTVLLYNRSRRSAGR